MFAFAESQHHIINPTNPRRALDDGVEDRLHVRGRAADDAEHLGGCRLMLQRFAQFCVALAEFLEQAHILDGDDRLISEGFEKADLLIRERLDYCSTNNDNTDRLVLAQKRRGEHRSETEALGIATAFRKLFCSDRKQIFNVNYLTIDNRTADSRVTIDRS